MSDDLKPCPFCGGEASKIHASGLFERVYCKDCFAQTGGLHSDRAMAKKAWNTRPADALTAERDALKQIAADHVLQELEQAARADKAEAKLAKAVDALREALYFLRPTESDMEKKAGIYRIVTTLEEIEGAKG